MLTSELIQAKKSKGEVLIFPRLRVPAQLKGKGGDLEGGSVKSKLTKEAGGGELEDNIIVKQTATFSWQDVCLDITIKGQPRRLLDNVDGWVKPGTLTALMVCMESWTLLTVTGRLGCRQDGPARHAG